jgi:Ca2+-binding RTX toxin-like protein
LADANADGTFEFVSVFLDESPLPLDGGDGVYSISLALGAAFTDAVSADYGTDGPGGIGFSLKLTPSLVGAPVYSGLYLLDPTDVESSIDPIGQGEQIRLLDIAGTVYGVTGIADTQLFSISVDNLGVVTFKYSDQVDPANIWHPDVLNDDESEFLNTGNSGTLSVIQRAVDADGDWVETANGLVIGAGNAFGIQDDGPTLTVTAGPVVPTPLVVDETFLGTPSIFDFSNLVNEISNVGTDKPGFDIVTNYTLSAVSPLQTNLIATAEKTPIFLFLEGGDVVGRAADVLSPAIPNPLGSLIFRLSLDSTTGVASLTQFLAVVHPIPGNANEPINTQIGDDQITITVTSTISDSDGDVISKSISFRIGDSLTFTDDAPSVAPSLAFVSLASVVSSLSVDETSLAIDATTDFSGDFASLTILPGNDGLKAQTIAYSLAIDSGSNNSGLKDSATGDAVLLSKSLGGEVFGTINSGATVVFKLTVDSAGKVTLDQQRSLIHPDASDPNDPVYLTPLQGDKQLISLVKSITTIDKDDDPLIENIYLDLTTALEFRDDGPTAKSDTDALASGSNGPESGNVISGVGTTSGASGVDLSGADAPATISAISGAGGTDSTPGNGLSIAGSYGNLNIDTDGNYIYNRTPGSQDNVNDVFTYTLKDSDGDLSTATLTINIPSDPSFIVGSPTGDSNGSSDPWTVTGDGNGIINGSANSDILIGDPGGSSLAPGSTANIIFVLDNSGSMVTTIPFGGSTKTRLRALQDAVIASLDTLCNSGAANIRVHIDKFSESAAAVGTFNLTTNSVDSPSELAAAKAAVNSITAGGTTNYEAGLQAALNWIVLSQGSGGPLTSATLSQLLFISDGEPNYLLNADNISLALSNTREATTSDAINSALGNANPPGSNNTDTVSEVDIIESSNSPTPHVAFTIEAIGINISSGALTNLTKIEGSGIAPFPINPDPGADNITTAEDLTTVLGDLVGGSSVSDSAGDDVINGGDSIDLIFGDALNSDQLAIDKSISATYPPGSGWDVFAFLEGPGGATKGPGGAQWTRTDSVNYIKANPDLVAKESGRSGGNDTIDGGNGDDVIYGQEGSDSITGAVGADRLSGGTGNDIFKYGLLASIATQTGLTAATADIITDFSSGSDKIQTGIAGVVGTNLRNDPGSAGRTFASSLVAADNFFNTAGNQAYNYFYTFDTSAAQTDAYLFFKSGGALGNCIAGLSLDRKPGTSLQNGDIV